MCFSPSVSFGAAIVLAATGAVATTRSKNTAQRLLAFVPILFAAQQLSEGVLWLSFSHAGWAHFRQVSIYVFLVFAQVVWPAYIPLAVFLFEKDKKRKEAIGLVMTAGILLSMYTLYCLVSYPVSAEADHHHIRYQLGFALARKWYYGLLYFLPTIVAPLLSSTKMLRWLGYLFSASYAVSRLLFHLYLISVWCFFGAIISLVIVLTIIKLNKNKYRIG